MPLIAPSYLYCTREDLDAWYSEDGVDGAADDDNGGTLDATETAYITKAINWSTARINQFCVGRYDALGLSENYVVNQYAVVLCCHWLSTRRGNPAPGSFVDQYDEVMEELEKIHTGKLDLPEIGLRNAGWPSWSNVRVDTNYRVKRVRVERPISDSTPTDRRQHRDYSSEFFYEP